LYQPQRTPRNDSKGILPSVPTISQSRTTAISLTMSTDPQAQPAPNGSEASTFTPPSVSHLQNVAYLVGDPIAHSSSPKLHDTISSTTAFPYAQILAETKDLQSFLTHLRNHPSQPRLLGSGVTMPHKVAVIPHLDDLTPEGRAVGAINTIFFQPNPSSTSGTPLFIGHNTDTIGIRDAFLANVPSSTLEAARGKPGLIIGGGGTCRAAIYALQNFLHCSPIYILNRDVGEVDAVLSECRTRNPEAAAKLVHLATLEQAQGLESVPGLVVSAVPDFTPNTPEEKMVREALGVVLKREGKGALLEMCYHPSPDTQISQLASGAGWQVIGGIEAMIGQGLEQAKLWAGITVDENLRDAARAAVRPKQ
jgi:quinate dehydrogenase